MLLWQRGRDCGDLVVSRASVLTDPPTGLSAFRVDGIAPAELVEPYLELHQPVRIEYPQESTEVSGRPVLEVTYERSGDTFYLAEVGEFLYWIELGPELTLDEVLAALPTT